MSGKVVPSTYLLFCRSAAGVKRPIAASAATREETGAPKSSIRREETPFAAANMEIPKEDRSARPEGTSIPAAAASSGPTPRGLAQPDLPTGLDPNEVPVGLIEDNLLSAELCNESLSSLHRVYKHFKVIFYCLLITKLCMHVA